MPMSMAEDGAEREREKKESRAMSLRERVENCTKQSLRIAPNSKVEDT